MKKYCKKYFIHLDGDEYINLNNRGFSNMNVQLLGISRNVKYNL